jgi:hypothetical protein
MRVAFVLFASAAALAVAACSNPAEKSADGAPDAAATANAAGGDIGAELTMADLPRQKPGVWRNTIVSSDGTTETLRQCIGADEPIALMGEQKDCIPTLRRIANGVSFAAQCTGEGGVNSKIDGKMTGDFQTRSAMEMHISISMGDKQIVDQRMRGESVYEGPCAAGQAPGLIDDGE